MAISSYGWPTECRAGIRTCESNPARKFHRDALHGSCPNRRIGSEQAANCEHEHHTQGEHKTSDDHGQAAPSQTLGQFVLGLG